VIGHPKGGSLSFSIHDNVLLDHKAPHLHYRAPTEGASSGSPVFNSQWKLVGLHHAGSKDMRRLNGEGTYAANEGIWIQSIIKAMKTDPQEIAGSD
jgi:V8-like Glu-specific endopeptidase